MWLLKDPLTKLEIKRQKLLDKGAFPKVLEPLYQSALPPKDALISDLKILSLDFETTGLNFKEDCVLSMGAVEIYHNEIDFAKGFHHFLDVSDALFKGSPIIHQITPEQLAGGLDPYEAMLKLIDLLQGKVLLTHAGEIERNFLLKTLKLPLNTFLRIVSLDTFKIEKSLFTYSHNVDDLSLFKIREKRGLPPYISHNAFADAVSTAEVFLAQIAQIFGKEEKTLLKLFKLQEGLH